MNKIRLLLADDHPLIRAGFKSMLVKNEHFEIVGEAENGTDLLILTAELSPDMILTDISMPGMNGLEALQKVKKQYPAIKCIVLTMHEEREYIMNALKTGAEGYLLKSIEGPELEKAILVVFQGGKYFSPLITSILADSVAQQGREGDLKELATDASAPEAARRIMAACGRVLTGTGDGVAELGEQRPAEHALLSAARRWVPRAGSMGRGQARVLDLLRGG